MYVALDKNVCQMHINVIVLFGEHGQNFQYVLLGIHF